jgi:hypothetical protein
MKSGMGWLTILDQNVEKGTKMSSALIGWVD